MQPPLHPRSPRWPVGETLADAAARYNARFELVRTRDMLRYLLTIDRPGRVALVTSFGTESAVLLHLASSIDPAIDVVFVDTGKHFPETLAYRDALAAHLGLGAVRTVAPEPRLVAGTDPQALRWSFDPDGCCELRKVEPLACALAGVDAWISGRKGFQSGTRQALPLFEADGGRLKINPLARWARSDIEAYLGLHQLPRHPLEAKGFPSIGCMPCTSAVEPGEDPRAGRWRGWDKTECGIHTGGPDQPAF